MRRFKGFTLIELLIVVAIIAILAAIAVPNFLEAQIRSKVSRAKTDMRTIATGLESYYVDNNVYPAWAADDGNLTMTVNEHLNDDSARAQHSFAIRPNATSTMMSMTTPIAYLTTYSNDPFADSKGMTFGYYSDPSMVGWIVWSYGPDTDQSGESDLNAENAVESLYSPFVTQPSITMIVDENPSGEPTHGAYTYDPTNGTVSEGDVYRVKQ